MIHGERLLRAACSALLLFLAVACGSSDPGATSQPSAGAGGAGVAGAPLVAGASAGGAGGVSSAGVATIRAGAAGSGQAGAAIGGAAGSAGTSGGGAAGAPGAAGSAGSGGAATTPATPSAGCAKMTPRPANGEATVAGDHLYTFPASYDGKTPMPVMVGFHANNNPIDQIRSLTKGSKLETQFVGMFPKSKGTGWDLNTDAPRFTAMFDDFLANYCVDTSRVFATGHSSGAQMVARLLCVTGGEKRFKAVAPVAASKYCAMVNPIPILYIQGKVDAMRGNGDGKDVVDVFVASNGCTATTTPDTAVGTCKSNFDQMLVTPGCITYQGCSKATIWCSHNDNTYNNTDGHMHGWPCFASSAIADFFISQF